MMKYTIWQSMTCENDSVTVRFREQGYYQGAFL